MEENNDEKNDNCCPIEEPPLGEYQITEEPDCSLCARIKFPWLYKLTDGLIAGSLGVAASYPLDLVKTRFENQVVRATGGRVYKSLFECLLWTLRRDGYMGLYKRSSFNILVITPEKAIKLAANDYFTYRMDKSFEADDDRNDLRFDKQVCAAGMAGFCQCVTTPLEMFRCRLLAAEGMLFGLGFTAGRAVLALRPNSFSIVRYMYQQGLVALTASTLMRDIAFTIVFCPLFRTINGGRSKRHNTFSKTFICGFVSGGCSSALVTPFEVVRRHIAQCRWQGVNKYKTIPDSIRYRSTFIYTTYGARGFYYGWQRRLLVAAPLFGITEATYHLGISEKVGEIVVDMT